jgi:hypothetical protein
MLNELHIRERLGRGTIGYREIRTTADLAHLGRIRVVLRQNLIASPAG